MSKFIKKNKDTEITEDVGVIVGRFQVHKLHKGHIWLINSVRELHEQVIIFLGVKSVPATKENPLDFITRKKMISEFFPDVTILQLPDMKEDTLWSKNLDRRVKEVFPSSSARLYGSRDSFIPSYSGNFPTTELDTNTFISGSEIRQDIKNEVLECAEFRQGVIYGISQQYNSAVPAVDVVIINDKGEFLVGKKPNEFEYRFVGGHVDPTHDLSYEEAAMRESREETHLELSKPTYIGSLRVDDWRWRDEINKIYTAIYICRYVFGKPIPDDDIQKLKWICGNDIKENLVKEHKRILELVDSFLMLHPNYYK